MLTGRSVKVDAGGKLMEGECEGIEESGELVVQTTAGIEKIVAGSVVKF